MRCRLERCGTWWGWMRGDGIGGRNGRRMAGDEGGGTCTCMRRTTVCLEWYCVLHSICCMLGAVSWKQEEERKKISVGRACDGRAMSDLYLKFLLHTSFCRYMLTSIHVYIYTHVHPHIFPSAYISIHPHLHRQSSPSTTQRLTIHNQSQSQRET